MLSDAQKSGQLRKFDTKEERFYKEMIKKACQDTGFVPQHPDTLVVLDCLIEQEFNRRRIWFRPTWMNFTLPYDAKSAVKKYAK